MKAKKYSDIFIKQEFKLIIGKGWRNFWILAVVFAVTIFALEFSRSGMKFLSYKMSDPFINWIDVKEQPNFEAFMEETNQMKDTFNISTIEANNYILEYVFTKDYGMKRVEGRSVLYDSNLLNRILDGENTVVVRRQKIDENDYGWIVTKDLMLRLGYDDKSHYPLYINYTFPGSAENLEKYGLKNFGDYFEIPIPVIAVVEQLPDLLDFIAPVYFMEQNAGGNKPFIVPNHENYFHDLYLVAENPDAGFENRLKTCLDNTGLEYDDDYFEKTQIDNLLRPATQFRIIIRDSVYQALNKAVAEICEKEKDVYRTYDWAFDKGFQLQPNYLSFMFEDLAKVKAFSLMAKEKHGIRIDMAQIEAKENFNTFNILSSMLCLFIAIIAIAFVTIFLYFLIDAHFRRISKNLGTIMAFGLANKQIISTYLSVFMLMIIKGLIAVIAVLGLSEIVFNMLKWWQYEGGMPHFSLCDVWVIVTVLVIPLISAIATVIFLRNKLKATPGDLIFERNV
ncbi:MAG: ABC transporter permease [Dysgonamonadaceae bacterium]|jgi:hypothetical protein|nr:ABC transporter permease [Dysgonamonadaceae bacterium]